MKKVQTYKGWVIALEAGNYLVFSAEEWAYGSGCRYHEFACQSLEECKENIDSD